MQGQYLGDFTMTDATGTEVKGRATLNLDALDNNYFGAAFLHSATAPDLHIGLTTKSKADLSFESDFVLPVHPTTRLSAPLDTMNDIFPGVVVARKATGSLTLKDNVLTADWTTDLGHHGHAKLRGSAAGKPSVLQPLEQVTDWRTFKAFVADLPPRKFIFRGQSEPWRLRTTYHRTGRAVLGRYRLEDIPALHRHLSSRTRHVFDLSSGDQTGSFYSLIQHYGYPTPLLDWTFSPYVAAFFAYRTASRTANADARVRIFVFDHETWSRTFIPVLFVDVSILHMTVAEFIALENERLIPQQSVSMVTNIDDLEGYIRFRERQEDKTLLRAIDLPVSERKKVLDELAVMGVTAGSLLPGIEGMCEEMRERRFP